MYMPYGAGGGGGEFIHICSGEGGGECNAYRYVSEGDFEGARGENLV